MVALADDVAAAGPLDILINNACQTVRRYAGRLRAAGRGRVRAAPRPARRCPEMVTFDRISEAHPAAIAGALAAHAVAHHEGVAEPRSPPTPPPR